MEKISDVFFEKGQTEGWWSILGRFTRTYWIHNSFQTHHTNANHYIWPPPPPLESNLDKNNLLGVHIYYDLHLKKYWVRSHKQQIVKGYDKPKKVTKAPIYHIFDDHKFCGPWCKRIFFGLTINPDQDNGNIIGQEKRLQTQRESYLAVDLFRFFCAPLHHWQNTPQASLPKWLSK